MQAVALGKYVMANQSLDALSHCILALRRHQFTCSTIKAKIGDLGILLLDYVIFPYFSFKELLYEFKTKNSTFDFNFS